MKIFAFLLGGILGVLLLGAAALFFLFSGGSETAPTVSPPSMGVPGGVSRPAAATRGPGALVFKAKVELPPELAGLAKDGLLIGSLSYGARTSRRPWQRIGSEARVVNPTFPLDIELELTKDELEENSPTSSSSVTRLNLYFCRGALAEGCMGEMRYTLRARKNLVEKTEGKPFREVFRGKSEIDLGRVNLNLALKQREPQGCLENRNSLSGKLVLSPKLRAKIAELGGAVVVATPERQLWEFFQTQRLDAAQAEQTLNLQGIKPNSGYQVVVILPCKANIEPHSCVDSWLLDGESSKGEGLFEFGVVAQGNEFPYCGQTDLKLFGFMNSESPDDQSLPPEVRMQLENLRPAI